MKINILASMGFSPSTADITETYSLLLYIHISNKFFVASAEETAQASHLYYKFVSGSSLPMIQKHERNILRRERLKSAWRGEAESVTVSSRQLFVANSKNWNGGNLWKSSDQCVLSSHMCQIPEYLPNLRQRTNQRPLSELERNVTLFGKNVVTIPKLTTSQSMKKEAHFQH